MTGPALAESIRVAMGFPLPLSAQLQGWGSGVVSHIQSNAIVSNASGTVTGTVPPSGGALLSGAATGGLLSGLDGATMADAVKTAVGYPNVSAELLAFCTEIADHIELFAVITFNSGSITGTCTNTPLTPGILTLGAGSGGFITGLDGDTLADAVHASIGYPGSTSDELKAFCNALVDYIEASAVVAYASGSVTGVCPAAGGALAAGTGAGGTVS